MKLFGQLSELVKIVFRQNGQAIELDSNAGTTYTATRLHQLPPGDSSQVLVSATSTQTLTGKTIDGDDNTVQDLALTSLKTQLADADKVLRRDASGIAISGNSVPNNSPLLTTDATQALTNKTLDGDLNTVQDLALTSLKTVLGDANKLLQRDVSGIVISGNTIPNSSAIVTLDATQTLTNKSIDADTNTITNIENADIKSGAAIDAAKLADGSVDNTEFQRLGTAGTAGAGNLVTTDGTQVLTAKDIDGGTASNTSRITIPKAATATLNALTRKQGTLVYDTDVNKLKFDDGSILNLVGSGSGAGSINYILNPDAEENTLGWATYADAASAVPVDGTGGSPNVTFTRSTSSPLRGTASFLFTKDAANRQGQGASYNFTIASADVSKTLQISFDFEALSGYATNDMRAYIYDVTNAVLITPAAVDIAAAKYQFQTTFVASTSTSYRLILHVASTNATAYTARFDNVVVGPQLLSLGSAMSDWTSFVPVTQGFGTISSTSMSFTRVGPIVKVLGDFVVGTSTAVQARINLPQSGTSATSSLSVVGQWWRDTASGSSVKKGAIIASPGEAFVKFSLDEFTLAASPAAAVNGSDLFIPSNRYYFSFELPVAEWANSSVYLSGAQPEYAFNTDTADADATTGFGYGPQGTQANYTFTAARKKRVRFLTPRQATDMLEFQVSEDRVNFTTVPFLSSAGSVIAAYDTATNVGAAITLVSGSTTDFDVQFGRYRSATNNWSNGTWYWRVVKVPGQVQVASPVLPTATSMSDISATALGYKIYRHGTAYNGGNAPTVTLFTGGGTLTAITSGSKFIPRQMQDGSWLLDFEFEAQLSSAARTVVQFAISGGFVFPDDQALGFTSPPQEVIYVTSTVGTTNRIQVDHQSATSSRYVWSGRNIAISQKPTWAY
jgi:hypothetical protein